MNNRPIGFFDSGLGGLTCIPHLMEALPEEKIFSGACPAFVPLIEEGIIENDIMNLTIKYYLDDFIKNNNIDTLVLGCTHYPPVSYTHLRAHETRHDLVCRLLLE